MFQDPWDRREFLKLWGRTATGFMLAPLLSQCVTTSSSTAPESTSSNRNTNGLDPKQDDDDIVTLNGINFEVLVSWGDTINQNGDAFGYNNDFIGVIPMDKENQAWMMVNHETHHPLFVSGWNGKDPHSRAQVVREQESVGVSVLIVKRDEQGRWRPVLDDPRNFRLSARTPIAFSGNSVIAGKSQALGTLGNCCGGVTPWQTFLTCEENFDDFYAPRKLSKPSRAGWEEHFPEAQEHYGWVVEVNPKSKRAKKLIALGRMAHEGAHVVLGKGNIPVVYMGDDTDDRCFYKFIGAKPHSLEAGTLYVARTDVGIWEPITLQHPKLKGRFKTYLDLMIHTREAAEMVGGTPLDRPEGAVFDQRTGSVMVSLTNNYKKNRPFGQIARFSENNKDPLSLQFQFSTLAMGGPEAGFACPDNLVLDKNGNLWFTTDVSEKEMSNTTGTMQPFGHNALYFMPLSGDNAGKAQRLISAPNNAELTGPAWSPDGRTLFLSVQHPGSLTTDLSKPTSHWNMGENNVPRPAVIAISGPAIDQYLKK